MQRSHIVSWVTLALFIAATGGLLLWQGNLQAEVVNDTASYADFPFDSFRSALTQIRTPGYPLLMRVTEFLFGDDDWLPGVHFLLFAVAVAVFHWGLLAQGCSPRSSPWIAGALLASNILVNYVQTLATDTVAAATGVASCGCLFLWTAEKWRIGVAGLALALCVCAGWLIRPANLFLIPFAIIVAPLLALRQISRQETASTRRRTVQVAVISIALTVLPLLGWCGLRWMAVGKFGIVSFGGYNLIGITGQFLDETILPHLSPDNRKLAEAAWQRRDPSWFDDNPYRDQPTLNYMRMELNYDPTIWKMFVPTARQLDGDAPEQVNSHLKNLGIELAARNPVKYGGWIVKASRQALWKVVGDYLRNPVGGLTVVAVSILIVVIVVQGWVSRGGTLVAQQHLGMVPMLFVTAWVYTTTNLAVTILVCPPLGRMTDAAAVLVYPLGMSVLCACLRRAFRNAGSETTS